MKHLIHVLLLLPVLAATGSSQVLQSSQSSRSTGTAQTRVAAPRQELALDEFLRVESVRVLPSGSGTLLPVEINLERTSDKEISAYAVSLSAHNSNGTVTTTEMSEDILQVIMQKDDPGVTLEPGAALRLGQLRHAKSHVRIAADGLPPLFVDGKVTAVVFMDHTARGDSRLLQSILSNRRSSAEYYSKLLQRVRGAAEDPSVRAAMSERRASAAELFRKAISSDAVGPASTLGDRMTQDTSLFVRAVAAGNEQFTWLLDHYTKLQAAYSDDVVVRRDQ